MPQAGQDYASNDEVKVYKDEGENEDEKRSENLNEEKLGLVTETEEVVLLIYKYRSNFFHIQRASISFLGF